MTDECWVPIQVWLGLRALLNLGAGVHDVYDLVAGGGDNNKHRFELSEDKCMIRCSQGNSVGSGVRPDWISITAGVEIVIHGTSLESARLITQSGLSRCQRSHVHFCECGEKG